MVQLRQSPSGKPLRGTVTGQVPVWNEEEQDWEVSTGVFRTRRDPVYVEDYLEESDDDIRTAIITALADNPLATTFILPSGEWEFVGSSINQTNGLRNGITFIGQHTNLYRDMAGVASGQQIFFLRSDTGVGTHADDIHFINITFSLLNCLTSFFGYAIGLEAASNCSIEKCTAICTLDPAATQGRIRWGFNLFGGNRTADPTAGKNNRFVDCRLSFSQIQGCGAGRSADGVTITNTIVDDANDLAISVVADGSTNSLENVTVLNTICHNVAGSGVVFVGTDGQGTGIGVGVFRNCLVDGVWLNGERSTPDLDFEFANAVLVNGGLVTQNVIVTNVGTKLAPNATNQARSIQVNSQDDETSWNGLVVGNASLGVVTTDDPLEALFISGRNIQGVTITNVDVQGIRGIRLLDCDKVTLSNCTVENGTLLFLASSRSLTAGIAVSNCNLTRTTGFQNTMQFTSTNGRSMSKITLSNLTLNANGVAGLNTSLAGGTMQMFINNIENTSNSNPSAETLTGIIRAVNVRGFVVTTTVSVAVPAVAAGVVAYVDVSMAGTRLSDLAVGESIVVNPQADLIAAGAGGGLVSARVSATGSVRLGFSGTANAAVNHSFARAA